MVVPEQRYFFDDEKDAEDFDRLRKYLEMADLVTYDSEEAEL